MNYKFCAILVRNRRFLNQGESIRCVEYHTFQQINDIYCYVFFFILEFVLFLEYVLLYKCYE